LIGRMIRPFDTSLLKPTSYELTLASKCIVEGKEWFLTEAKPVLEIPPNSVAFVAMQQVILLPHFLVGRFDLAIKFIYQGLLLGTGPQVDAGFQGALSCPLHNISNNVIPIRLGEPFAKLDFVKTCTRTDAQQESLATVATEMDLERWAQDHGPYTKLFKGGHAEWREPILDYLPSVKPKSSVAELRRTVERLERLVNYGGIVGFIGVLVAAAALVFALFQLETGSFADKADVQGVRACQATFQQDFQVALDQLARERRPASAPQLPSLARCDGSP
jgi:deoxycytidine triphosphate deaminase